MPGQGTVYLIHFDRPLAGHASHYLGWTGKDDLADRYRRHLSGDGARILRAAGLVGITFRIVRTWEGDRHFERALKKRKKGPKLCPVCRGELTLDAATAAVIAQVAGLGAVVLPPAESGSTFSGGENAENLLRRETV
jgi:predicted GIY-YIG superfamily endonuclease